MAAFADFAVVKPQVAFFEAYGAAGFAVLERTIAALRSAGVLVLADAKRGDIGSTMAAYADAWAGDSPLAADAVTASPYLGFGSLQPLLDTASGARPRRVRPRRHVQSRGRQCAARRRGRSDGGAVDRRRAAAAVNRGALPEPGSVGVVVGATLSTRPTSAPQRPVLVPGVGAQGGRPEALGGLGGARPGSCCPRCRARFCAPGPKGPNCAPPPSGCATPSPIWPDRCAAAPARRSSTTTPNPSAASRIRPVRSPRLRVR